MSDDEKFYTCPHFPCAYWSEEAGKECPEHDLLMFPVNGHQEARREHELAGEQYKVN